MSVIVANLDDDDSTDDDEVSHKHCNCIPPTYIYTPVHMYVHTPLTCDVCNGSQDDTPVYCVLSTAPTNMCMYCVYE